MIVYLATNLINGKQYVGYTTKHLNERIRNHVYKSKSKNHQHYFYLFQIALRKYGLNNFKWDVLYETNELHDVLQMEIYFIKELNTISPNGYNLTEGGNGGTPSNETKIKISNSVKNYYKLNPWTDKIPKEIRSGAAKQAWDTKNKSGFKSKSGYKLSEKSRDNMSLAKNEKNKLTWINLITGEEVLLSCTKMSEYTGLSNSTFNHIKNGRQHKTKCGWTLKINSIKK